jgi:hypothetical protein
VDVVLVLTVPDAEPGMTIGVAASDLSVESDFEDDDELDGDADPSGMMIGFDLDFSSSPPLSGDSNCGGQSTEVGGQLSPPPPLDESDPGGGHPEPAPKSPGVSQSARATPTGTMAIEPTTHIVASHRTD